METNFLKKYSSYSKTGLICMGLVIVILSVYLQVGNNPFMRFDDGHYITGNPHIANGITGKNIIWAFTSVYEANWHPITWVSHMADVQLFGMSPRGHHLSNVIIHTGTSLLVLFFLLRYTGSLWKSAFVAALFALHPLHVESVAWVSERKDVLSAFFWFLTLIFYAEYLVKQKPLLYRLALFFFISGLLSKPMVVTLPIVLLMMHFWPLDGCRRERRDQGLRHLYRSVLSLTPFFVCSILSCIVTIYAQNKGGAICNLDQVPIAFRLENTLISYVKYLGKTIWPNDLGVLYPFPLAIPLWQPIASFLLLLLLSVVSVYFGRRYPYIPFGWFWFLITLVPVIGLIQIGHQSMADRYSYIPIIGLFIIVAWGFSDLTWNLRHQKSILALLAGVAIIASTALTWRQLGYWRDDITLFRHTLQVTTDNSFIHRLLGVDLGEKGDLDAAAQEFRQILLISPDDLDAHHNLAVIFYRKGDLDAAIHEFQEELRINPNDAKVLNILQNIRNTPSQKM